jgi:hypothetical protein
MLKILLVNDVFPHINNRTTIFLKNIVPIISKKFDVKVYWLITDNYGERNKITNQYYEILYMSDFKNSLQVIQKIKPNLMYYLIGWHITDYALMVAGNYLKIPSFGYCESAEIEYFDENDSKLRQASEYLKQSLIMKNVIENNNVKKSRAVNFIKKVLFLYRSILSIKKSHILTVREIFSFFSLLLGDKSTVGLYSKFNCDLMFTERMASIDTLVKWGLKKENCVSIDNPAYDKPFKESKQLSKKFKEKINIIFITSNLSGAQGKSNWSITKQNQMIKELIISLNKINQDISLTIKIHPTSEDYIEYKKLLEPFRDVYLSQTDEITDLLHKSDIVITPCASTAGMFALIMKKPIIIWNYFQVSGDMLLRKNIVLECKHSTELHYCINNAESFRIKNNQKINEFINETLGNGNSIEKSVYELEKWLKNNKIINLNKE